MSVPGIGSLACIRGKANLRRRREPLCLWYLLFVGWLAACGTNQDAYDGPLRFVTEDPEREFRVEELYRAESLASWSFVSGDDLEPWRPIDVDGTFRIESERLLVRSSKPHLKIYREIDFEASTVDALEVRISGGTQGEVLLWWAGRGESISGSRHIALPVRRGKQERYVFRVGSHPGWEGRIRKVWVAPTTIADRTVRVRDIRVLQYSPRRDRRQEINSRAWKLELAGVTRNVRLSTVGRRIKKGVTIPRDAELRFALAAWEEHAGRAQDLEFRVLWKGGDHSEILFEGAGGDFADGTWHEHSIDLSAIAEERGHLVLATDAAPGVEPAEVTGALAVWAHPEVVQVGKRSDPPNVVLVSLDTLRADHLSLYGYHRRTSPHIDEWAKDHGVTFLNAVAPSPWTLPSHTSMFTGWDAFRHGVNHESPAPWSLPTLAEILRHRGYFTGAFTGKGFLSAYYGLSQGFDVFSEGSLNQLDGRPEESLEEALAFLESHRSQPFFLFFHTYEIHTPYNARQPYFDQFAAGMGAEPKGQLDLVPGRNGLDWITKEDGRRNRVRMKPEELDLAVAMYDSGIALADSLVGRLLDGLQRLGLTERTLVVVTSDHGELIGEHGAFGHQFLYEESLLVPLILAYPGVSARGRRVEHQVRLVDVVPTILDLLGLQIDHPMDGVSLRPLVTGTGEVGRLDAWSYASIAKKGVSLRVSNRIRYTYNNSIWPDLHGEEELYLLRDDPEEEDDRSQGHESVPRLRERVREKLRQRPVFLARVMNDSSKELRITLKGSMVRRDNVKSSELPCPCVHWIESGFVEIEIPASRSMSLELEDVGFGELEVRCELVDGGRGGTDGRGVSVRPTQLEGIWTHLLKDREWVVGSDPPQDESFTGIVLGWRGDSIGPARPAAEVSPELRKQLEALGYI